MSQPRILLLYTGGTIGMIRDEDTNGLKPFNVKGLLNAIPELPQLHCKLEVDSLDEPIDSSNMTPEHWDKLAHLIENNYDEYDGFVILHGSDTMAYTASALSFMLEGLSKPVVLTGSQLPVGVLRSDARENLLTAIEIAGHTTGGMATVPEVCIYFEYSLYRGNRAHKFNSENFEAFLSVNYPSLAMAGVSIRFDHAAIALIPEKVELNVKFGFDTSLAVIRLFPGMDPDLMLKAVQGSQLKGLIIETFGSGNAPTTEKFNKVIADIINGGTHVLNITQCKGGRVDMGRYNTSKEMKRLGVISGHDMTMEAAITKMMFLLGQGLSGVKLKNALERPLHGELSLR